MKLRYDIFPFARVELHEKESFVQGRIKDVGSHFVSFTRGTLPDEGSAILIQIDAE